MATGRITKRAVDAESATGTKHFLWDDQLRGFGLQITATGAKSYIYQYRLGGRESLKKRYTIGRHGSPWTPDSARAECKRLSLLVAQGIDPSATDLERRRQAVDLAFSAYIKTFTDGYLKAHWKGWSDAERLLRREPLKVLQHKPMPTITKADIVAVLDQFAGRPAVARLAFSTLRKMFAWAEGRGEIDRSPIGAEFPAPKAVPARSRVLSDEELALAWRAAGTLGYPFGPIYQLLMITAARRDEVAELRWSELDQKTGEWTLPSDRAKNNQAHIVPLADEAVAILDEVARTLELDPDAPPLRPVSWPKTGLVFTTTGKTPVSGHSRGKQRLDAAMTALEYERAAKAEEKPAEIASWRIHDLRRTAATGFQRLGIRFEVTEAILNHVSGARGGVAGVYQRHDWKAEKQTALEAWARHLAGLINDEAVNNVLPLKRRVEA